MPRHRERSQIRSRRRRIAVRSAIATLLLVPVFTLGACDLIVEGAPLRITGVDRFTIELDKPEGVTLAVWETGEKDAQRVIYVHGTPGSTNSWHSYLRDPLPGVHSIAFDRPGFGETRPKKVVSSFEEQAAAIEPLLKPSSDGRWPILVGHSLGGPIVARAAADYPDRVGGVVIVAGSLSPELEKPRWYNYAGDFPVIRPFLGRSMGNTNDELMEAPEQTKLLDDVLERVTCPVVIVHGTKDKLVPYANVAYMESAFVNAESIRTITIDGEGHFIIWSHKEQIREAITSMLGEPND